MSSTILTDSRMNITQSFQFMQDKHLKIFISIHDKDW